MRAASAGQHLSPRFPVAYWRLANGLTVVVQTDTRWPLVAATMCYATGSRSDPAARSGLAHFCEHLAFDGPTRASNESFPVRIERAGGAARALTTSDRICFSTLAPSRELPAVLDVEAERMAHPLDAQDEETIEIQRRVLLQELRERSQAQPRVVALEQLHRLLFPDGHAYHCPPAGETDDIPSITAADVKAFAATHFSPRNAILVLVGDVSADTADELGRRLFEGLPAGVERHHRAACVQQGPPRESVQRVSAAISAAHTYIAWTIPGFGQPEWYVASLLVRGLAVGRSNPLTRMLAERTGATLDVHSHLVPMRDASTLVLAANATSGVESGRLEEALADVCDRLLDAGLSTAAFERAGKKALTDYYFNIQNLERRADLCAALSCYFAAPDRLSGEPQRYVDPDPADVASFAAGLRRQPARAMLSLIPREGRGTRAWSA